MGLRPLACWDCGLESSWVHGCLSVVNVVCCKVEVFCGMETETVQHIICCCEALARQHYNVFGRPTVEPKDISTASIGDLCVFTRGAGLLRLC